MIRFALRLIGLILLAGAFAAAVIDGARSLADQKIELSSMGTALAYAFPAKFALMHDYVVRKAPASRISPIRRSANRIKPPLLCR